MKAMILAAGFGTRLRPLTNKKPKALIEVAGRPLLEWVILKLRFFGFESIVINTHHFADQIADFLAAHNNFKIEIKMSQEEKILGTGGGIKRVHEFFSGTGDFLVHNVDVLSTLNLADFMNFHRQKSNLATLFVQNRESKRALLFDENNFLKSRSVPDTGEISGSKRWAFNGIHAISAEIFHHFPANDVFSITDIYLAAAQNGAQIYGFSPAEIYWRDLGRVETVEAVTLEISHHPELAQRLLKSSL